MQANELKVSDLDLLVKEMVELGEIIDTKKAELTELNKQLIKLEAQCVGFLKDLQREDYLSPLGKIAVRQKWRVNMPATDLDKEQFFSYLKEQGLFEKYATVHSASLNSYYMAEWQAAKDRGEGMEFSLPGIPEPKMQETLEFRKRK